jgi:hypothetical protein
MNFISYKKSPLYDEVVEEYSIFNHSYDFMVFLAVLGYQEDNPVREDYTGDETKGTSGQIGAENFFSNEFYRVIAACIAYQDTGDEGALGDRELQAERLAQYAAGGLEIAEEEFGQIAGDPTDALVNYIRNGQADDDRYQGTLGEIVKSFDEEVIGIEES